MLAICLCSYDVVLDCSSRQVRIGNELVTPEPKVVELLGYLMSHPGRLVTKAELLDSIWSGEVVGESVLSRCISYTRKLLSDRSREPRFIRTVHGRGYEFIAPVDRKARPSGQTSEESPPANATNILRAPGSSNERPFVGRTAELANLRAIIGETASDRARLILVTGEPGIGKTRLVDEATRTTLPVAEFHWARAPSAGYSPPFRLWRQCFRSIVRERSAKAVHRALRGTGESARRIVLGTESARFGDSIGWDSPSERFRTFDTITEALTRLALLRALMLVVEDLHVADLASLLLLEFVVNQGRAPLLVLGTVRDNETAPGKAEGEALARLRKACCVEIRLQGLDPSEIAELAGPEWCDGPNAMALWQRTAGNPLFVTLLTPPGQRRADDSELPVAVRQAVADRLASLPSETARLLPWAAVLGREFDIAVLSQAIGWPLEESATALGQARTAGLLSVDGGGRYRFVHDLVRESLYQSFDPAERARAHLAVGKALAARHEYQQARQAALLAHHFVQALECGGATKALDFSVRAGAYALGHLAYEEAARQFSCALRLVPLCPDVEPASERAILLDLGSAQISAGDREAGSATLHLAATKAREQGSFEDLASVALNLSPGLFAIETGVYDPSLVALLREAIEAVGSQDPRTRTLLLARLAIALYWADTYAERVELCDEATRLAETLGAEDVKAAAYTARAFALLRPDNLDERRRLIEMAIDLNVRAGDHESLMVNRLVLGAALREQGDAAGADFEEEAFRRLAEKSWQPQALWIVEAHRAMHLFLEGRLDEVEALVVGWVMTALRTHDHNAQLTFGVLFTLLRIEQGRTIEILDLIRDYAARYPRIIAWRAFLAYALAYAGSKEAEGAFRSLKEIAFDLPLDLNWMASMVFLTEACHELGDEEAAATLYARLLPYGDRLVVIGYGGIACLGSVQHYLGLLATTCRDWDTALRHLEQAIAVNRGFGATLPLAHALCEYACTLRNADRDPERMRASFDEAAKRRSSFASGCVVVAKKVEAARAPR
ncbi:MAG TPA: AAA family ATPase [Polyangiaceae bacterium]|nr:AAA family ATPase [Polyangiaceae bacterium]